jgi:hypothetical protein
MERSKNIPKRVIIICGLLVIFLGVGSLAMPPAESGFIVPLVPNTPGKEAYILLDHAMYYRSALIQAAVLTALGVAIVTAGIAGLKK